jgi:hypothetical protein
VPTTRGRRRAGGQRPSVLRRRDGAGRQVERVLSARQGRPAAGGHLGPARRRSTPPRDRPEPVGVGLERRLQRPMLRSSRAGRSQAPVLSGRGDDIQRHPGPAKGSRSVEMPPWPDEGARVRAGRPLEHRLGEVARLRGEADEGAERQRAERLLAEPGQQERADRGRGNEPAYQALDRLRRRDVGQELVSADLPPHEVCARVVAPDGEHEQQHPATLRAQRHQHGPLGHGRGHRGHVEHERDQADVGGPEHRRRPRREALARVGPEQRATRRGPPAAQQQPCRPGSDLRLSTTTATAVPNSAARIAGPAAGGTPDPEPAAIARTAPARAADDSATSSGGTRTSADSALVRSTRSGR